MKVIRNASRYITRETLDQCFEVGRVINVDKVLCGNGFSTAFLTTPPPQGMVNIMVAPNKQVVISKERSLVTTLRVRFIYEESQYKNISDGDLFLFVADSFVLNLKYLISIKHRIHRILIDEFHSIEIQSAFRRNLVRFLDNIKPFTKASAITTVTATPNYQSPIDIKILNPYQQPLNIHVTRNREESILRCVKSIHSKALTLVCTNDASTIYQLKHYDKTLSGRYMVGDSLARSLVQRLIVHEDENSNLVVCSSRGFEGMDLDGQGFNVFFFENRGNMHECFYLSNLYQAINRPRAGYKYAEYCRQDLIEARKYEPDEAEILRFIERKDISPEQKQGKKYEDFHGYVVFKSHENAVTEILTNDAAIRLRREKLIYDTGYHRFDEFTSERLIKWIDLDEEQMKVKRMRTSEDVKIAMLELNTPYIEKFDLFGDDFTLNLKRFDTPEEYIKHIRNYQMLKNYDGFRADVPIEAKVIQALENAEKHIKEVRRARLQKWLEKYSKNVAYKKAESFKQQAVWLVGDFFSAMVNKEVKFNANWVAHRNYNVLTMLSEENIHYLAEQVGVTVTVVDIRNCFPRLAYALAGVAFPIDFYGGYDEGREKRKISMNVTLNTIWFDPKSKSPAKVLKSKKKADMLRLGYHPQVVDYLIEKFFETPYKGDFFNFMAWHEKQIISEVKRKLIDIGGASGYVRRHDSLVLFNNELELSWLNNFHYLGCSGWFNITADEVQKIETNDDWEDETPFNFG